LGDKGQGIVDALQRGYDLSSGQMISRMDGDDICQPTKFEVLERNLSAFGKGGLATAQVEYFSETDLGQGFKKSQDWMNALTERGTNFSDIYKECVVPSPCWLVYRSDFDSVGGFNSERIPEDYDLCFRFYKAGLNVLACSDSLLKWRDYSTRTSRISTPYLDNDFAELKTFHFLDIDYNAEKTLLLWGAGRRAKKIAIYLVDRNISFHWVCNNENKIGQTIYGQTLKAEPSIQDLSKTQLIMTVVQRNAYEQLKEKLKGLQPYQKVDVYWFC